MDIKDNATYPYPIWGLHEDFNGPEPEGSYEMKLNETADEFILNYNVITNNEGIKQLITEEKAVYKCIVECNKTYYLQTHEQATPNIQVKIPVDRVYKRISVKVFIVATKDIVECTCLDVSEFYEGVVNYPKGGIIAYIDNLTFELQQQDNETDLSKIFRTKAADVQNVEYSVDNDCIVIKFPQKSDTAFESVKRNCPEIIEGAFVYPALVYALSVLPQHYPSDKDWVYYLTNIVDGYFLTRESDVPEDYKLTIEEVYDIANASLAQIHTALLEETRKIIDQILED